MKQRTRHMWDLDKLIARLDAREEPGQEAEDGVATINKWLALADRMLNADR